MAIKKKKVVTKKYIKPVGKSLISSAEIKSSEGVQGLAAGGPYIITSFSDVLEAAIKGFLTKNELRAFIGLPPIEEPVADVVSTTDNVESVKLDMPSELTQEEIDLQFK